MGNAINAEHFVASSRRKTHIRAIEKAGVYLSKPVIVCEA